ncbi:maleylpyruvate isomerase [Sphingomonas sp. SORGH_AS802]|uniref:maleylacetoacetate isomerase n=1 Tax=unclassified Sphingomonas TaxID=196159 RepID=UPI0028618B20|nr:MULTISPECIES: maleylacetoacetate isomerase [unclassified Sphingomonas]MDR6126267.1 maleylpyruvate isomerase [Sphingomonas sp. SORGH_AS_0438]MDR6135887.1 maleylpyruvate isomerase [Sphingomonas sp. SORGH_AS_0802]
MIRLHGYWRSGAAYRVRIGLALKGVAYEQVHHDLRTGAQRADDYARLNPQRLVPTLEAGDLVLTQSVAILEWLDECHPQPPLLPGDPNGRAIVRSMAATIASDTHPLHNLRVLNALRKEFGANDTAVQRWIAHWLGDGLAAVDRLVERHGDGFAYGDRPTLADCCIVPALYAARRFAVDLTRFPALVDAGERAMALPEIAAAHPDRQPDADR